MEWIGAAIAFAIIIPLHLGTEWLLDRWRPRTSPPKTRMPRSPLRIAVFIAYYLTAYVVVAQPGRNITPIIILALVYGVLDAIASAIDDDDDDRWKRRRKRLKAKLASSLEALRERLRLPSPQPAPGGA